MANRKSRDSKKLHEPSRKLVPKQARAIRRLKEFGLRSCDIAQDFGVSPAHISNIAAGRAWKE